MCSLENLYHVCDGSCGGTYNPGDPRCLRVLVGVDGEPNGYAKCPGLGHPPRENKEVNGK